MSKSRVHRPIIRLLSVAGSCKTTLAALGCARAKDLVSIVQGAVGDGYRVTASAAQVEADEDDQRGGRRDDAARAREIERTLADDRVVAAIALRGGAWLTRVLPRVDFDVLRRRRKRIAIFGFSEISPLLNIAACYERVVAYHDLCPAYLLPGMTDYARHNIASLGGGGDLDPEEEAAFARGWAAGRFRAAFEDFFRDAVEMIEGRPSARTIIGQWTNTEPPRAARVTVVGGNLTTIVTLIGTEYGDALCPDGKWLLLEDVRETPDRVDRLLSHLSLSGLLPRYEGILLGRFSGHGTCCTGAVVECLKRHLGRARRPIVITEDIGHTWPLSPIPLGRAFEWRAVRGKRRGTVIAHVPWSSWRV